jgi:hypothetical protein
MSTQNIRNKYSPRLKTLQTRFTKFQNEYSKIQSNRNLVKEKKVKLDKVKKYFIF